MHVFVRNFVEKKKREKGGHGVNLTRFVHLQSPSLTDKLITQWVSFQSLTSALPNIKATTNKTQTHTQMYMCVCVCGSSLHAPTEAWLKSNVMQETCSMLYARNSYTTNCPLHRFHTGWKQCFLWSFWKTNQPSCSLYWTDLSNFLSKKTTTFFLCRNVKAASMARDLSQHFTQRALGYQFKKAFITTWPRHMSSETLSSLSRLTSGKGHAPDSNWLIWPRNCSVAIISHTSLKRIFSKLFPAEQTGRKDSQEPTVSKSLR